MKIFVTAKTGARENIVEKINDNEFTVWVKEQPEKGKANRAIIKALAAHFNVTPSSVIINAGHTSKKKIVDIRNV